MNSVSFHRKTRICMCNRLSKSFTREVISLLKTKFKYRFKVFGATKVLDVLCDVGLPTWVSHRTGYDIRPDSLTKVSVNNVTIKLLHADCLNVKFPTLDRHISTILLDPPYGLNKHDRRGSLDKWDAAPWTPQDLERFISNLRAQGVLANRCVMAVRVMAVLSA